MPTSRPDPDEFEPEDHRAAAWLAEEAKKMENGADQGRYEAVRSCQRLPGRPDPDEVPHEQREVRAGGLDGGIAGGCSRVP